MKIKNKVSRLKARQELYDRMSSDAKRTMKRPGSLKAT